MSILVNKKTRIIVQGITGKAGSFHTERMLKYGTKVVAGVTPGRGGSKCGRVPVFDTVKDAKRNAKADASVIFVPAPFALDAILEAASAGLKLIICITEGIPILDMIKAKAVLRRNGARLIGPNCPGIITPGEVKIGIMPGYIHKRGPVGIVSRSGTLTYEAVWQLTKRGIGQSTCIGIGGDPILGTGFVEVLEMFEKDPQTKAVLLIGEIGGSEEEEAAAFIKKHMRKPVAGFVAGVSAPPDKRMGHAGAIVSQGSGRAADKIAAFRKAGVVVPKSPSDIGECVERILKVSG